MNYNEFESIFTENCNIYLDTNCLLSLYKIPEDLFNSYTEALKSLPHDIRISHTVKQEYERNKVNTIQDTQKKISNTITHLDKNINGLSDKLNQLKKDIRLHDNSELPDIKNLEYHFKELENNFDIFKSSSLLKPSSSNDKFKKIEEYINKLFGPNNMIKKKNESERIKCIIDGYVRAKHKYPPGYVDMNKKYYKRKRDAEKNNKNLNINDLSDYLGDYFIWTDIIFDDIKNNSNKLFVTNDMKEDWWNVPSTKNIEEYTPRKELEDEFHSINIDSKINFIPFNLFIYYLSVYTKENLYESYFIANNNQIFIGDIEDYLIQKLSLSIESDLLNDYQVNKGLKVQDFEINIETVSIYSCNLLDTEEETNTEDDTKRIIFYSEYYFEGEGSWKVSLGLENDVYEINSGNFRMDDGNISVKSSLEFSIKIIHPEELKDVKDMLVLENHQILEYYDEIESTITINDYYYEEDLDYYH
ncbi:hypothetical protein GCM10008929_18020 [Alkalibacterium psychrotolerans]